MPERLVAPDQTARDRITGELASTLFVEAGAGSGKTTALVDRAVALVTSGTVELAALAAITFTEKAATELRDRIRRALEETADERAAAADEEVAARCRAALDQLDGAAIGTLHSFAQRLLAENPVEAGLPPRVEVLDEVSSDVEFERRWTTFRDELLADPSIERTLLLLLGAGVRPGALRALAVAFDQNWDLVAERVPADAPDPPPVDELLNDALVAVDAVCDARRDCSDGDDKLLARLDAIADYAAALRDIDDEVDLLDALGGESPLARPTFRVGNVGRGANWACDVKELQALVATAGDALGEVRDQVAHRCAHRLGSAIRAFTIAAAEQRRAAGRLQFHDLLVMARALLRDPDHGPAVRARLQARYQRLLLDEFQDTDPIQVELAVRIAAADPADPGVGAAPWTDVEVGAGRLFFVGDPKQSIYRFRRADISTFLTARDRFASDGEAAVELVANFRSTEPVIEWVNHVFEALFTEPVDVEVPVPSQPPYVALQAVRERPPAGPAVAVMGREEHPAGTAADDMRAAEASDVVAAIQQAVGEAWPVGDGSGGWRPARLGDITVLVPARTSLPFLEDALDDAGIAYRAEASSLVYATRAVRDLRMVLRAADDPTDHLRIVSALRTPLLGCGDDDLFRFKVQRRGHWNYLAEQPDTVPADDPVRAGLAFLRELHQQRHWRAPSELLEHISRERRAMELGFAEGRPRDVWRRLRFVVDQARAWHEATGGGLRHYLRWVDQQTAEGARVAESVLPETDDDAVRIMTIHAAKGLQFPITILSGMTTVPQGRRAPAEVAWPPAGGVAYRFWGQVSSMEWQEYAPIDEQMAYDERLRLLYVACTRAQDHLVVSLHRRARAQPPRTAANRTNAELLVAGMGAELDSMPEVGVAAGRPADAGGVVPAPVAPPPPFEEWAAERDAALTAARRSTAVAATALTDEGHLEPEPDAGLEKRPRDLDLPPWLKGRYGTAVGRAVHGALQSIDLATGDGLAAAVAAQCQAEAVPDRVADVRGLVEAALGAPVVRAAAAVDHWKEVYACTPVDGRLLEGYVDLLYRGADGLVVVDYKTAATADDAELERRVEGYRLQGASYAVAVGQATGEPVTRVVFLFLTPSGAVERDLPDLGDAIEDVRRLVVTGREVTVG